MFRIYYDDGNVFTGEPQDAPKDGVICILQADPYHMVSNAPYYIYVKGYWLPAYENDIVDYLKHKPGAIECLVQGRIVSKKDFTYVYKQAQSDRQKENLG